MSEEQEEVFNEDEMVLQWLDPYSLKENPLNPRKHPQAQRRALFQSLKALKWVKPLLLNRRTGNLIDGHMRRQAAIEMGVTLVPVIIVDLDPEQEKMALASLDTITTMAKIDDAEYEELMKSVHESDEELYQALQGRMEDDEETELDIANIVHEDDDEETPLHLVPGEQYNYVMLLFRNDLDWLAAIEHFDINKPAKDLLHNSKVVGRTRVIEGSKYLADILRQLEQTSEVEDDDAQEDTESSGVDESGDDEDDWEVDTPVGGGDEGDGEAETDPDEGEGLGIEEQEPEEEQE